MVFLRDLEASHPAWIEIDLGRFKKNIDSIRKKIGRRLFCLCVKADAYGHGLCEIGKAAEERGVDYLGVSCLKEGIALRSSGISIPIFVFGAFDESQVKDLIEWELEFTVSSKWKAQIAEEMSEKLKKKCYVHLEVDTGLRRTGVRPETALDILPWLSSLKYVELAGVYSHFAMADEPCHPFVHRQIEQFRSLRENFAEKKWVWHLANSGGVVHYPDSYFDMVRPGLVCYGYFPGGGKHELDGIAPCFSLKARVSYFKVVEAGEGISYGHLYKTKERTRIVTVPLGYADGFRRAFSNKGFVLIRGKRYKIAGVVCMDQFMVDVGQDTVHVGDEVTLIGCQGTEKISLEEAAFVADMIPYELLCSLRGRLSRLFTS